MSNNNDNLSEIYGLGIFTLLVGSLSYYFYKKANSEAKIDEAIAERIRNSESIKMLEEGPSISTNGINLGRKAYSFDKLEYDKLQKKIESMRGAQTTAPLDDIVSL
ncbi:hypothetical protein [Fusobacterium polymorphum]|uniref:hypothetical protein n=1 Tax=Fusobacterium nucleatum subsp. polymorphum TaxID=76857 RepID=UPI0030087334